MKVSIIVPVYNVAPYITRCLDSICRQTYSDLECIIVDDRGTDNSMQIVNDYIGKYSGNIHFVVVQQTENWGVSAARNKGVETATGDFIYFLDSDDAISPDCFETLVSLWKKYPDTDFVEADIVKGGEELNYSGFLKPMPEYSNVKSELDYLILGPDCTKEACNILLKRSFVIANEIRFPEGILHEDLLWRYFLAKHTTAAAFDNKGVYYYYRNCGSTMTSPSPDVLSRRYVGYIYCAKIISEDISRCQHLEKYQYLHFLTSLFDCCFVLGQLHSLRQWLDYWLEALRMMPKIPNKWGFNKLLFLLCLMPPLCFIAGKDKVRWKVKQYVINRLWEDLHITFL